MGNSKIVQALGILLVSIAATAQVYSQTVKIIGKDTAYAGKIIEFEYYTDEISATTKPIAGDTVAEDGSFSLEFDIKKTTYIFSEIGIYYAYFFAEPSNTYKIVLPQFSEKTKADKLNPYFKPVNIHLAFEDYNENELNVLIRIFNESYIPFYNKHLKEVYVKDDFSTLNKDIERMDKPFEKSKNEYFNQYRRYRYGLLRYLAYQQKSKSISDEYFKGQPVLYNNPAYMELFNLLYDKYFTHLARTETGKKITEDITKLKDSDAVKKTLANDMVLQPEELLNMVMLKGLHDEFYDDKYSRSILLEVLDDFIKKTNSQRQKDIAQTIREKVTKLLVGYEPPQFELYNQNGELVKLKDFKGKYVYLNFCSCFSYACLNEFAMLNNLYEKHKKYLEIVTIIADDDQAVMADFIQRSQYPWQFLHYERQPDIIEKYDVRVFPTYYLIDNEGKLELSPAPSPQDNFEGQLFKILKSKGII